MTTARLEGCCTRAEYTRGRIERIDRHIDPQIVLERVTRYGFAAPLIDGARAWCDLSGGTAGAAADALPASPPERTLLVDADETALETAARELEMLRPEALRADLAAPEDWQRVERSLRGLGEPGPRCITAFGAIERIGSLENVIAALKRLACEIGWDVVFSLGNDALWPAPDAAEGTRWSEGAIEELRSVLPAGHIVATQRQLVGSRIDPGGGPPKVELRASLPSVAEDSVATHFLVAFGPRVRELASVAAIADADLSERRAWERRRDARLGYLERVAGLPSTSP